ncbi:LOW QUALITY PROTEIN: receptor-like protein kinase FERONIA [Jatropha curcas]|uniref:LOW QUALITY PROTEIN: receptor-like protein kinase FERONIA n=1 Tax=Jatropha curcas TaxID=180498 RepID=UPI001894673B|nr:LOW QUALITY PROTEIN: receptor-like protein kinase FERONIA [Jatropha curcas]
MIARPVMLALTILLFDNTTALREPVYRLCWRKRDIEPVPSLKLEIFKLNNSKGSLAGPNSEPIPVQTPPVQQPKLLERTKRKNVKKETILIGPVFGGVLFLAFIICFFVFNQRRRGKKDSIITKAKSFRVPFPHTSRSTTRNSAPNPSNQFRRFSIFEIEVATSKFDDEFVIGSGGFGNVYKGSIDDGAFTVAIKRLHSSSKQGAREFKTEIQMLSKLRHTHLVSLIGYCDDPGEMILVYEFMHRGTLRDHLYKTKNPPLKTKKKPSSSMEAKTYRSAIGAAHGLQSNLHKGAKHPIIPRAVVKSTNILIDENWVAKVSDFGLSRMGPTSQSQTHVSTVVRGSIGYVDPEYYRRQHLTEKSDVYSFGVVLLEILCARPPVIPGLPKEQANLADWARICYRRGVLDRIMDPHLRGDADPACLEKFGEIAESCLRDNGAQRPGVSIAASRDGREE